MSSDFTKLPREIMLDLMIEANPDAAARGLVANNIIFSEPEDFTDDADPNINTRVVATGAAESGLINEVALKYARVPMWRVLGDRIVEIGKEGASTAVQLLPQINAMLGINLQPEDIVDVDISELVLSDSFEVAMAPSSLIFVENFYPTITENISEYSLGIIWREGEKPNILEFPSQWSTMPLRVVGPIAPEDELSIQVSFVGGPETVGLEPVVSYYPYERNRYAEINIQQIDPDNGGPYTPGVGTVQLLNSGVPVGDPIYFLVASPVPGGIGQAAPMGAYSHLSQMPEVTPLSGTGTLTVPAEAAEVYLSMISSLGQPAASPFEWSSPNGAVCTDGAGHYVAIGERWGSTTGVAVSSDGVTWQQKNPLPAFYNRLVFGNGVFMAWNRTGNNTTIARSTDFGETWSSIVIPGATTMTTFLFAGGLFIAIGNSSTTWLSDDALTWGIGLGGAPAFAVPAEQMTYGNGILVACNNAVVSSGVISTGPNNVIWTDGFLDGESTGITMIAFGGGRFVATGNNIPDKFYSDDGITWTKAAVDTHGYGYDQLIYSGDRFLLSNTNNGVLQSVDGEVWEPLATFPTNDFNNRIFASGGKVFRMFLDTTLNYTSLDVSADGGDTWNRSGTPPVFGPESTVARADASETWVKPGSSQEYGDYPGDLYGPINTEGVATELTYDCPAGTNVWVIAIPPAI